MNRFEVETARVELLCNETLGPLSKHSRKTLIEITTAYLYGRIVEVKPLPGNMADEPMNCGG